MVTTQATIRRKWRRAVAETRYGYSNYLTRRSTRSLLRVLLVVVVIVLIFTFHDSRKPKESRVMRSDVVRAQLSKRLSPKSTDPRTWAGWKGIKTIYAFGDSQTDTGFNLKGPQPDRENPIGNPSFPGRTSSYRANYLGHLTGTFNQSRIMTYNMANNLSPFWFATERMKMPNFQEQIDGKFLRRYGPSTKVSARGRGSGVWNRAETLFVMYVGPDDIINSFQDATDRKFNITLEQNLEAYYVGLNKLYDAGARNFLIINYPQLENAPGIKDYGDRVGEGKAYWRLGATIVQYNSRLAFMAHRFAEKHNDANVFVFNSHKLSLMIRLEPTRYPETSVYTHLFGYCFPYAENHWYVETSEVNEPLCSGGLQNYFWRDEFHYSEPMQKLMARLMVEHMADPANRLPLEFW